MRTFPASIAPSRVAVPVLALVLVLAATALSVPAAHADEARLKCTLTFKMAGWSALYKTADGSGTVHCDNGKSVKVKLSARGGGPSVGKSSIDNGHGEFSSVANMEELFGSYVAAEAHAGAVKSSTATVVTKGEVSLALSGTGRGFDLGIAFGKLTISK